MTIIAEGRSSDSPYIETVLRGITARAGAAIRPAESSWHMVIRRLDGKTTFLLVGPLTNSGTISYGEGAELLWIKFRLGTYLPHLPLVQHRDLETELPAASGGSFWLGGSAWEYPDFENVETFIDRLARSQALAIDPVIGAVLQGETQALSPRTVRHHFLHATGLTHRHIRQVQRARQAADLLAQGVSISDTLFELGYYDQPHLTRALKQWIGFTPAQILQSSPAA